MLIAAVFSLRVIGRVCFSGPAMKINDMTSTEFAAASILGSGILVLGVWPAPLIELISGSVAQVARHFVG
jgi:NADH-quinone oxidoreductase subunit M